MSNLLQQLLLKPRFIFFLKCLHSVPGKISRFKIVEPYEMEILYGTPCISKYLLSLHIVLSIIYVLLNIPGVPVKMSVYELKYLVNGHFF